MGNIDVPPTTQAIPQEHHSVEPEIICPNAVQLSPAEEYRRHGSALGSSGALLAPRKKSLLTAYCFSFPPLGILGAHHFYLGRPEFGLLYLFTLGLAGIGWLLDLLRMPLLVRAANKKIKKQRETGQVARGEKSCLDAYILWMPLGLLGFHHYYLGRWPWAIAYTFTCGLGGAGWLFDGCRMKALVREANERRRQQCAGTSIDPEQHRTLVDAYVLGLSIFGLLGAHHYYMGRFFVGIVYTFSAGLLGIGWMYDWATMPVIFKRSQHILQNGDDGLCYLDDAYRFLWPFGFLGLHHFYLGRPGWGCLYLFTLGLLAVGWIVDFFRLPKLLEETNKRVLEQRAHLAEIQERLGPNARVMGNQNLYVAYPARERFPGDITTSSHQLPSRLITTNNPPSYASVVGNGNTGNLPPLAGYHSAVAPAMAVISEEEEVPSAPPTPKEGVSNEGYSNH